MNTSYSQLFNEEEKEEEYTIRTAMCKRLSKEFNIEYIPYDKIGDDYVPPKESGLSNCQLIIPPYYQLHKYPSKILDLDYFEMIKDDIRNCRILNEYQIKYISQLPHEEKNELLSIYNNCIIMMNEVLLRG